LENTNYVVLRQVDPGRGYTYMLLTSNDAPAPAASCLPDD
jgi:hypothetical protein